MMKSSGKVSRLAELYREGGASEIVRGVYDYLYYTEPVSLARGVPGRLLGGEYIWEWEWDVLCVLDGCRVDVFRDVYGDCESMRSVGSASRTWVRRTFGRRRDLNRVAYITANPHWDIVDTDRFGYFHVEGVRETNGVETTPPERLTDRAIDVWRRREELGIDRVIVHYMQPHTPFRRRPEWFTDHVGDSEWGSSIWERLEAGELPKGEVLEAFRDNLEWVLEDGVEPLSANCDGRIALTADHGNAVGEEGYYGHGMNYSASVVRDVPWRVLDGTDERTREPSVSARSADADVDRQLEALGYK